MDVYKTWTPSPWTTLVDLVRRPLRGPSPWTTLVDAPIYWRWILPVGLNMIWIIMSVKEGIIPQKQTLLSVYIIRLMSFSYYTLVQFFLAFHTWIRCSLVKDEQYLCFGGSSLLCKRLFHRVAYPPQNFLSLMAHGNVSSSADLSQSCLRIKHKMACI